MISCNFRMTARKKKVVAAAARYGFRSRSGGDDLVLCSFFLVKKKKNIKPTSQKSYQTSGAALLCLANEQHEIYNIGSRPPGPLTTVYLEILATSHFIYYRRRKGARLESLTRLSFTKPSICDNCCFG